MKRVSLGLIPCLGLALLAASCGAGESAGAAACGDGPTHTALITRLGFTREGPMGVAPGFDLDDHVSDGSDAASCFKKDFTSPDGKKGIDNQLAALIPDVEKIVGNAVDGLIQGAIDNGDLLILMDLEHVESTTSDACVGLTVRVAKGKPSLGTDGSIEAWQTFTLDATAAESHADQGRIDGGVMTTGPFELALPIAIFDVSFTLHVHGARVRFTINPDDGTLDGILGGGVVVEELLDGVKNGAGLEMVIPLMRVVLNGATDLAPDADGVCQQVSAGLTFKAVPAFVRSQRPAGF